MKARVTIEDLAKELNLSKTSVSMVLSGRGSHYNISTETQKKVLALAKKRNYQPNQNARSLRTGKSDSVGLVLPDISNVFYAKIARILEREFEKRSKKLLICSSDEIPNREKERVDFLISNNVDGIIAASCLSSGEFYKDLEKKGKPVVLIDRHFEDTELPSVVVDNFTGANKAVEKMINSGRKNIYMLTLTPAHISPLKDRYFGFRRALEDFTKEFSEDRVIEISYDELHTQIEDKVGRVLAKHQPDGFFVTNNALTMSLLQFLKRKGIQPSKDVGVVSFDDIPAFELIEPAVSAVSQPVVYIAEEAAKLILDLMDAKKGAASPQKAKSVVLSTSFMERSTT